MNDNGDGKLVELQDIGKANKALVVTDLSLLVTIPFSITTSSFFSLCLKLDSQGFTPDSFRHLCILCGCDYLPSVPGVGPATASKLMKRFGKDPYKVCDAGISIVHIINPHLHIPYISLMPGHQKS